MGVEWDENQEFLMDKLNLRCLLDIQSKVLEETDGI